MAKKNKKDIPKIDTDILDGQLDDLQKLVNDMIEHASEVVKEYDIDLSDPALSGSISDLSSMVTEISEDSPYLDEVFKGEAWKKVLKATIPNIDLEDIDLGKDKKEDKKDDSK